MYKAHWCFILFRNITLTSVIHQIIFPRVFMWIQKERWSWCDMVSQVKYYMTWFYSYWFECPSCLLMFIFSLQCMLKAEAKYLHFSSRMLEMEKQQKQLTFSQPSLPPYSIATVSFSLPSVQGWQNYIFSVRFCYALFLSLASNTLC